MARLWGALTVLLTALAVILTGFYTDTSTAEYMISALEQSAAFAKEGNTADAVELIQKTHDKWKSTEKTILLFVPYSRVEKLDDTINGALRALASDDMNRYEEHCSKALNILEHLRALEYPMPDTIL